MRLFAGIHLFTLALFLLGFPVIILAQSDTLKSPEGKPARNIAIQTMYQNGYVFATNPFLRGINAEGTKIDDYQAFSLKLSHQTTGNNLWEQLYRYPQYGIGFNVADFFNPEEIGVPIAVYGFLNAPFIKGNRLAFNYEIGFGATFNWKSFNPVSNQYNVSIGAGQSFLINAGLNLQYQLTKRIELSSGFMMTHFSNGAMKKPNFGINTISPFLSLQYNFYDVPVLIKQNIPEHINDNEWLVTVFGGFKNVIFDSAKVDILEKFEGLNYPVFGFSTTLNRQISYKSKLGIGFAFSYNGAVNAQAAVDANELDMLDGKFSDKILLSIYPSYELVIHKVSITFQPAVYLYRKKIYNLSPAFHQRIGLKYQISNHIFAGITLVDYNFHVSDFIEWNVGYSIRWK